jgi:hypothetical protein
MNTSNTSTQDGRRFWIILFVVLAVILLAGAAYLWGNRLNADTLQADSQSLSAASSARYGSSLGVSAVRAVEASASQASLASRYGSVLGISAIRAADALTSRSSSLRGVAGVRSVDQAANASISLRASGVTQGLSNLETQRVKSQTQGLSNLELLRAKQ